VPHRSGDALGSSVRPGGLIGPVGAGEPGGDFLALAAFTLRFNVNRALPAIGFAMLHCSSSHTSELRQITIAKSPTTIRFAMPKNM